MCLQRHFTAIKMQLESKREWISKKTTATEQKKLPVKIPNRDASK